MEDDHEATLTSPLWVLPVRDPTVMEQSSTVGIGEMRASIRKDVVEIEQFMSWDDGQRSFVRNPLSSIRRGRDEDQIDLADVSEEGPKRCFRVIPRIADLITSPAKVIHENNDVVRADPLRIGLRKHSLAKQIGSFHKQVVETPKIELIRQAESVEHGIAALASTPRHRSESPVAYSSIRIHMPSGEGRQGLLKGTGNLGLAEVLNNVKNARREISIAPFELF